MKCLWIFQRSYLVNGLQYRLELRGEVRAEGIEVSNMNQEQELRLGEKMRRACLAVMVTEIIIK